MTALLLVVRYWLALKLVNGACRVLIWNDAPLWLLAQAEVLREGVWLEVEAIREAVAPEPDADA